MQCLQLFLDAYSSYEQERGVIQPELFWRVRSIAASHNIQMMVLNLFDPFNV